MRGRSQSLTEEQGLESGEGRYGEGRAYGHAGGSAVAETVVVVGSQVHEGAGCPGSELGSRSLGWDLALQEAEPESGSGRGETGRGGVRAEAGKGALPLPPNLLTVGAPGQVATQQVETGRFLRLLWHPTGAIVRARGGLEELFEQRGVP